MWTIKIPDPIQMKTARGEPMMEQVGEKIVPFIRSMFDYVLDFSMDPAYADNGQNFQLADTRSMMEVQRRIGDAVSSGKTSVVIDKEEHKRLVRAIEKPQGKYNPWLLAQQMPFADAIVKATEGISEEGPSKKPSKS